MVDMQSYNHTPMTGEFTWATLPEMIKKHAKATPDKEVYVFRKEGHSRQAVTFSQLDEQSDLIAVALRKLNLQTGQYAVIVGISSYEWMLADVACMKAGVPTVRMSVNMANNQGIHKILNTFEAPILFYHPGMNGELKEILQEQFASVFAQDGNNVNVDAFPHLKLWVTMTMNPEDDGFTLNSLLELGKGDDAQTALPNIDPDDLATVYMTSGSTGFPKCVPHSHFSLVNHAIHTLGCLTDREDTRYLSDRSLAWAGSLSPYSMVSGNTTVYLHPVNISEPNIDFYIQVIEEENINNGLFLKYLLVDLIKRVKETGVNIHIPRGMISGEVIHSELIEDVSGIIGNLQISYGCTEMMFSTVWYDTTPIPGYVGFPAPGIEMKIIDSDGKVLSRGEVGTLCARGGHVQFRRYLFGDKSGMSVSDNGWVNTGDMAVMANDGCMKIAGRKEHIISRGTIKHMPCLIEEFLLDCPFIYKVTVIGVPDKKFGEEICACIITQKGVDDTGKIKAWCNEGYLTDGGVGMIPGYFLLIKSFPTVNGKIDKVNLKKWAMGQIGLE